jgi:hypothetical protein
MGDPSGDAELHACDDPQPARVVERLQNALEAVDTALKCVELEGVSWVPVESERWEAASRYLEQAREELQAALAPWTAPEP